jgi:hypothetical protein
MGPRLSQSRGFPVLQASFLTIGAALRDMIVQAAQVLEDVFEGCDGSRLEGAIALALGVLEGAQQGAVLLSIGRHALLPAGDHTDSVSQAPSSVPVPAGRLTLRPQGAGHHRPCRERVLTERPVPTTLDPGIKPLIVAT